MHWSRILLLALGLLFAAGGTGYYLYASSRIASAADWPTAQGQVVDSLIDSETRRSGSGSSRRETQVWIARITYRYEAGGQSLTGNRIWLTAQTDFSTPEAARSFIAAYPPGGAVAVHYDPANPADAALIIESKLWPILILAGVGGVLILLGLFLPLRR